MLYPGQLVCEACRLPPVEAAGVGGEPPLWSEFPAVQGIALSPIIWHDDGMEKLMLCLTWLCRIFLGFIFVLAGVGKLLNPSEPAQIWAAWLKTNVTYLVVAFVALSVIEVVCAIGVVLGRRPAVFSVTTLSALFLLISVLRFTQVIPIPSCGCFGLLYLGPGGGAEVLRDGLLLSSSVLVLVDSNSEHRDRARTEVRT